MSVDARERRLQKDNEPIDARLNRQFQCDSLICPSLRNNCFEPHGGDFENIWLVDFVVLHCVWFRLIKSDWF